MSLVQRSSTSVDPNMRGGGVHYYGTHIDPLVRGTIEKEIIARLITSNNKTASK